MYLLDAAVAAALTTASWAAVYAVDAEPVLRRRITDLPAPFSPDADKSNIVEKALAAGFEIVPMHWAVYLWWAFTPLLIGALLVQRRWPVPALVLAFVGAAGHYLDLYPLQISPDYIYLQLPNPTIDLQPIDLAVPICLLTVVSQARSRWRAAVACLVVLLAAGVIGLAETGLDPGDEGLSQRSLNGPAVLVTLAIVFAVGDGIRSHRAHARALELAAAELEREQQRAELASAAERARIARELHDVVAHSLSVMVAQAQAALAALPRRPERTAEAMQEVVTVGRASLAEMRRVLGVLGPAGTDGNAPAPGLAELPALVDRVRAAGVPVRLDIDGQPAPLPAGVDLSAYRIVQEALTNTLKHAGAGAQSTVSVAYRADHVDIHVDDDGAGRRVEAMTAPGNGLRGIAERVSLLGGELTVGPAPERGFLVRARLPVGGPA
jgi:signal transduction histidine kinase